MDPLLQLAQSTVRQAAAAIKLNTGNYMMSGSWAGRQMFCHAHFYCHYRKLHTLHQ